jgi:hypothetical protein
MTELNSESEERRLDERIQAMNSSIDKVAELLFGFYKQYLKTSRKAADPVRIIEKIAEGIRKEQVSTAQEQQQLNVPPETQNNISQPNEDIRDNPEHMNQIEIEEKEEKEHIDEPLQEGLPVEYAQPQNQDQEQEETFEDRRAEILESLQQTVNIINAMEEDRKLKRDEWESMKELISNIKRFRKRQRTTKN